jgi:CRP/FNR family transcriptional regulator, cyclic AMP receptor protein
MGGNVKHNPALAQLSHVALFSACSTKELELIAGATTQLRFAAGQEIAREGTAGHEFIVIVEGKARVTIGGKEITILGPGEFFGEIALLDDGPRTATVVAETDILAEVIGQREFSGVVTGSPQLAKKLLVGLARRLRAADLQLAN